MSESVVSDPVKCTWKGCQFTAMVEELDRNGNAWALLCLNHHNELSTVELDAKQLVRVWALAGHDHPKRQADIADMSAGIQKLLGLLGVGSLDSKTRFKHD